MTLAIYSHNKFSEGAKALAEALGVRRIKHENSRYRGRHGKTVINWGSSQLPDRVDMGARVLNRPENVAKCSDKLKFFHWCLAAERPRVPDWTTDKAEAEAWLENGDTVVCRAKVNGSGGEGITIIDDNSLDIPLVPLYTNYVPKKEEWRIHIFKDGDELVIIDQQRKIKRPDFEGEVNWKVRNHDNGFIFIRNTHNPNPDILNQAIAALDVVGLDFGAVDVLWNELQQKAYVLEVNTAPGLTGTTVDSYKQAFERFV